ncbi:dynamin family protein [Actinotignum sp. GS-2025f]|uniref:dynamin family protein n=1 Tax=unclassified Actinotignum TaxID=2632702 RepID=UPI002A803031|nr:dynamin family protein [Actinotignum sp. SLA_B059]MDY5127143.1 dynamin family protein [Actinotignum sp. SLA_B059]
MDLPTGLKNLEQALDLGGAYLDESVRAQARDVLTRARQRGLIGTERTVVALAGATGSGKSSLLNAIVGQEVAGVAATRPATRAPLGVSGRHASDVLDWLGVRERKVLLQLAPDTTANLVLVDLPDIDSTVDTHRVQAERIIARADVVIWVLDPQKYADAVVHEDFLAAMGEYHSSLLIVINQVDRLGAGDEEAIVADLGRILVTEGVSADIVAASALTGQGVEEIRGALVEIAAGKRAAAEKLAADVRTVGAALTENLNDQGGYPRDLTDIAGVDEFVSGLARAGGLRSAARDAADNYRSSARRATAWPLLRGRGSRALPGSENETGVNIVPSSTAGDTSHSGVPTDTGARPYVAGGVAAVASPGAVENTRVTLAEFTTQVTRFLPRSWRGAVRDECSRQAARLADNVARIIARESQAWHRPRWWGFAAAIQWLAFAALVLGALGIGAGIVTEAGGVTLPLGLRRASLICLVAGSVCGVVVSMSARIARTHGAQRVQRQVTTRARAAIETEVRDSVLVPFRTEMERYRDFARAVASLMRVSA